MVSPDVAARDRGRIRNSGVAALAFAAFQLWALPAAVQRVDDGWVWAPETVLSVAATVAAGVAAIRGSKAVAAVLGLYGAFRFAWFGLGIVHVLDGTAARDQRGPAFVLGAAMGVPFAVFWVRGGFAAWRARRTKATIRDAAV